MGIFSNLRDLFSNDIGIDLGTANTLVYVRGEGIVLTEPSVVAINKDTGKVLKVGNEAKQIVGRTPANIVAIRPLRDGVISDFAVTEEMLRYFIQKAHTRPKLVRPRVVIGVPSGITEVERRAVRESAERAGAREIYLVEEPMAAAIGAGLPIQEPGGNMIVDIGGGTTEVAVISLGGIVVSKSVRVAGDEMDEAIITYLKNEYNLMIGERSAEKLKIQIGSAFPLEDETEMDVKGRDLITGLPRTLKITSQEAREALSEPVKIIVDTIKMNLELTPPELSADIVEKGIVLCGGGSLLRGIDKLLTQETGLPINLLENPLTCVCLGTGKILEEIKTLREVVREHPRYKGEYTLS